MARVWLWLPLATTIRASSNCSTRPHRAGGSGFWLRFAPADKVDCRWPTTYEKEVFKGDVGHGGNDRFADASEMTVAFTPSGEPGALDGAEVTLRLGSELDKPGAAYACTDPQEPGQRNTPPVVSPCSARTYAMLQRQSWVLHGIHSVARAGGCWWGRRKHWRDAVEEPP